MTGLARTRRARQFCSLALTLLVLFSTLLPPRVAAQTVAEPTAQTPAPAAPPAEDTKPPLFRVETFEVGGGAELLTVFGSLDGLERAPTDADRDVPLVSILRDTLGDRDPENDRLRHVWMLTYTPPTLKQRLASAVPFFYRRVGNRRAASKGGPPPAVIDLSAPEKDVWERFMWLALQNVVFNPYGTLVKSSTNALRSNADAYRKAHIVRALAILALYEAERGAPPAFTPLEKHEINARLMLADQTLGGLVDDGYLRRVHEKQATQWQDTRGHNWELLRQRAEAEGLYFEPLQLPDGSATHALVWVAREELEVNRNRHYDARFLNIANPWRDKRLYEWGGYTEERFYDADSRAVAPGTPDARRVELIPLALYGLDNPKIPSLLVDFRDGGNPKRREMSRRVLEDVARNLLSLSRFGDIHYLLGRTVYDFVTDRRGIDLNQPSRVRAYSQLKLLLSLNASLDPALRDEIGKRLERVSLNPLENDYATEARLAREQYAALVAYARRADGLAARLDRERRREMVPLKHGRASRVLFSFANILSLGLYTHREKANGDEQRAALDRARRLAYHRRFLREVSKSSPPLEVAWDIEEVRRALSYVTENGQEADAGTAASTARIFANTEDEGTRRLCLASLYRINNETAKNELLRIYRSPDLSPPLRLLTAEYLRKALREEQRIAPSDARAIVSVIGQ